MLREFQTIDIYLNLKEMNLPCLSLVLATFLVFADFSIFSLTLIDWFNVELRLLAHLGTFYRDPLRS